MRTMNGFGTIGLKGRRRIAAVIAVVAAVTAVVLTPLAATSSTTVVANHLSIDSVVSPGITVPQTAGTPAVFVQKGTGFNVAVSFHDAAGNAAPLSTTKATGLVLRATAGPDAGRTLGTLSAPAGSTSATFTGVTLPHAAVASTIQAAVDARKATAAPASSTFAVQDLVQTASSSATVLSLNGGTDCTPTPAQRTCMVMLLPNGSTTPQLLSSTPCDTAFGCPSSGITGTWLVGLDPNVYTRSHPGTLIIKCDKLACPATGVTHFTINVQLTPTSPIVAAPACPAKNTVGADQKFCFDTRQSTRQNPGNAVLYLLFVEDGRVSIPN